MDVVSFLACLFRRVLTRSVAVVAYVLTIVAVVVGLVSPLTIPSITYVAFIVLGLFGGFILVTWEDHQRIKAFASGSRPELSVELVPEPVPAWLPTQADYETAHGGTTLRETPYVSSADGYTRRWRIPGKSLRGTAREC